MHALSAWLSGQMHVLEPRWQVPDAASGPMDWVVPAAGFS